MATLDFTVNGASQKVPVLDSNGKVSVSEMQTFMPQRARVWRELTSAQRAKDLWYTNNSGNEMDVHIYSSNQDNPGYVNIAVRANESSTSMFLINNSTASGTSRSSGYATIPQGWQYRLHGSSMGTRTWESWFELS
jgi:hypothetical protein